MLTVCVIEFIQNKIIVKIYKETFTFKINKVDYIALTFKNKISIA